MNSETWAIVAATFLGPIGAILVTRWRDWVRDTQARRMHIFRVLLATRRSAITPDHVGALNLIEVEFYGIRKIEVAWKIYHQHLNSGLPDRLITDGEQRVFEEKRNDLLAKLLFSMAQFFRYKLSELDIRNGGYAPEAWRFRDNRAGFIQDFAAKIAVGEAALPIHVVVQQPSIDITSAKVATKG